MPDELPLAAAVVDPTGPTVLYPFKHLAGCGVALKLVLALGGEEQAEELSDPVLPAGRRGNGGGRCAWPGRTAPSWPGGLPISPTMIYRPAGAAAGNGSDQKEITSRADRLCAGPRINAAGRMGEGTGRRS